MKVLEQLVMACRTMNYAPATERCYYDWVEDYLRYHRDQAGEWVHPSQLRERAVEVYLRGPVELGGRYWKGISRQLLDATTAPQEGDFQFILHADDINFGGQCFFPISASLTPLMGIRVTIA